MTPQDVLTDSYAKSKKNQPRKIAEEGVELLGVVNRAIRAFFIYGARVNPYFYMASAPISFASGSWLRPALAEAVFLIQDSGVEVVVVPIEDKQAAIASPAVYRSGQKYFSAGNPLDPTSGDLDFIFSRTPADAANLGSTIDEDFPVSYNELPILEVAIYLAIKDGRDAEAAILVGERDAWLRLYLAHLEHETMNEVRRWDFRFNLPSVQPLGGLLQGGTSVEV